MPHIKAFPDLRRAVDRVMASPNEVVVRAETADARDVDVEHRYTPAERGQALAFAWWVHMNRSSWSRPKLRAAIQSISPMMLFSSAFLAEMTGLPQSTVQNHMIRPPGLLVSRVTGSCDPWVVHRLLEASAEGIDEFRHTVREVSLTKGVPKAMMSRVSGVPTSVLLRPDRGIQFFPEGADRLTGRICTQDEHVSVLMPVNRYTAVAGDQSEVRSAFAGTYVADVVTTSVPVPREGEVPYFTRIPGLPRLKDMGRLGPLFYERLMEWEFKYHLPARIFEAGAM
ncbi:hypothetical protein ABT282_07775 [Streptomyces sp. NPDC000927]|uniref:hypothetical protein n=1 Tax=Streptomyces sp. NPDC000927 TaxID=3154371 RepID=UPI00332CED4A